jgi:hypothetical protein
VRRHAVRGEETEKKVPRGKKKTAEVQLAVSRKQFT